MVRVLCSDEPTQPIQVVQPKVENAPRLPLRPSRAVAPLPPGVGAAPRQPQHGRCGERYLRLVPALQRASLAASRSSSAQTSAMRPEITIRPGSCAGANASTTCSTLSGRGGCWTNDGQAATGPLASGVRTRFRPITPVQRSRAAIDIGAGDAGWAGREADARRRFTAGVARSGTAVGVAFDAAWDEIRDATCNATREAIRETRSVTGAMTLAPAALGVNRAAARDVVRELTREPAREGAEAAAE